MAGYYPFEGEMTGKDNLFDKIKKGSFKFPLNFTTIDKHLISQLLLKEQQEGIGRFTEELLQRVVISNPEIDFYFFFDRPFDEWFLFANNVYPVACLLYTSPSPRD